MSADYYIRDAIAVYIINIRYRIAKSIRVNRIGKSVNWTAGLTIINIGTSHVGTTGIISRSADDYIISVVAIDIDDEKLEFARSVGAVEVVNATDKKNVVEQIMNLTGSGAHVSIDALGSPDTCFNSIANLRKRGKHVQVGLMTDDHCCPSVPMDKVIAHELEIYGSHGIQAYEYPAVLTMIKSGKLSPQKLIGKTISLDESPQELADMNNFTGTGVTVINKF